MLNPTGTTLYAVGGAWSPSPITFVQDGGTITAVEVRLPVQAWLGTDGPCCTLEAPN